MVRLKVQEIVGHEPTAEDYTHALQAVEEMRELAANEPDFDKIVGKMFQIGNKYFQQGVGGFVRILSLGRRPDPQVSDWHLHMFDDAQARLEQLKKEAEKMD